MTHGVLIALLLFAPLVLAALAAWGRWLALLRWRGGRVLTHYFYLPDLMVAVALAFLLVALVAAAADMPKSEVTLNLRTLVADSVFKFVLGGGLIGFLLFRKVPLTRTLGLRELPAGSLAAYAVLFLGSVLPLIVLLGMIMSNVMHDPQEQEVVTLFREQARTGRSLGVVAIFLSAAVLAPVFEEFLFRGYFYGALKRYFGPLAAALLVSALFSLVHGNLPSAPGLFLLALALTVAYEWTGSLFVPILMHALFNTMGLTYMYLQARSLVP